MKGNKHTFQWNPQNLSELFVRSKYAQQICFIPFVVYPIFAIILVIALIDDFGLTSSYWYFPNEDMEELIPHFSGLIIGFFLWKRYLYNSFRLYGKTRNSESQVEEVSPIEFADTIKTSNVILAGNVFVTILGVIIVTFLMFILFILTRGIIIMTYDQNISELICSFIAWPGIIYLIVTIVRSWKRYCYGPMKIFLAERQNAKDEN